MKQFLILCIILMISATLFADDQNDALWKKAAAIAAANWDWVPGSQETINLQKNKKGAVKSEENIKITITQTEDGISSSLISATRDGEVLDENDDSVQSILKEDKMPDNSSLFHNFEGRNLNVTRTEEIEEIDGYSCLAFSYAYIKDDEERGEMNATGKVWLDQETGAPILNEMQIEPPKKMIKEISFNNHYFFDGTNWYMDNVQMKFRISTLIFKLNVESTINYSEFWKYTP